MSAAKVLIKRYVTTNDTIKKLLLRLRHLGISGPLWNLPVHIAGPIRPWKEPTENTRPAGRIRPRLLCSFGQSAQKVLESGFYLFGKSRVPRRMTGKSFAASRFGARITPGEITSVFWDINKKKLWT